MTPRDGTILTTSQQTINFYILSNGTSPGVNFEMVSSCGTHERKVSFLSYHLCPWAVYFGSRAVTLHWRGRFTVSLVRLQHISGIDSIDAKVRAQTRRKARRMVRRNWSPELQGLTVSLARRGANVRSGAPWQPHSSCPTTPDMPLGALCPDAEEESGPNGLPLGALCPNAELIEWLCSSSAFGGIS